MPSLLCRQDSRLSLVAGAENITRTAKSLFLNLQGVNGPGGVLSARDEPLSVEVNGLCREGLWGRENQAVRRVAEAVRLLRKALWRPRRS